MGHTEGKLTVDLDRNKSLLVLPSRGTMATVPIRTRNEIEDINNAQRLAACWNACEGISTEVLQGLNLREYMEASVEECRERPEVERLVKALQYYADEDNWESNSHSGYDYYFSYTEIKEENPGETARAALRPFEGKEEVK